MDIQHQFTGLETAFLEEFGECEMFFKAVLGKYHSQKVEKVLDKLVAEVFSQGTVLEDTHQRIYHCDNFLITVQL